MKIVSFMHQLVPALLLGSTSVTVVNARQGFTHKAVVASTTTSLPRIDVPLQQHAIRTMAAASSTKEEANLHEQEDTPNKHMLASLSVRGGGGGTTALGGCWQLKAMWLELGITAYRLYVFFSGLPNPGQPRTEAQKIVFERVAHIIGVTTYSMLLNYYSKGGAITSKAKDGGFHVFLMVSLLRHVLEWISHELEGLAIIFGFENKLWLPHIGTQNFLFVALQLLAIPFINHGNLWDMLSRIKQEPFQISSALFIDLAICTFLTLKTLIGPGLH